MEFGVEVEVRELKVLCWTECEVLKWGLQLDGQGVLVGFTSVDCKSTQWLPSSDDLESVMEDRST